MKLIEMVWSLSIHRIETCGLIHFLNDRDAHDDARDFELPVELAELASKQVRFSHVDFADYVDRPGSMLFEIGKQLGTQYAEMYISEDEFRTIYFLEDLIGLASTTNVGGVIIVVSNASQLLQLAPNWSQTLIHVFTRATFSWFKQGKPYGLLFELNAQPGIAGRMKRLIDTQTASYVSRR
jgi:hypothetical protein